MFETTMPKAAVHEQCHLKFGKNEIRFAKNPLIPLPAGDVMCPEKFCQRQFCITVTMSANPRHYFRPLCFSENVGHLSEQRCCLFQEFGYPFHKTSLMLRCSVRTAM